MKEFDSMQTLKYARAAAVVQACSYRINDSVHAHDLPWVGPALAQQIRNILHSGTCEQLEQMRCVRWCPWLLGYAMSTVHAV
jgi:DNA polymerase/3'-5' exonuclease PolX